MRTQAQERFTGQAASGWKARSVGAAAMVREAITQEMADDILSNSRREPHYSLKVTLVIGAVILALELAGVYLAVHFGY